MPTLDGNLRARMLKLARWETREPGEILVEEEQAAPQLVFIARGAASVERGGTIVGVCGPGDFLGEMSFLTGRPASATVRVANEIRCCVYDPATLKALTRKAPGIRQALEYSFNRNLVGKLERMNESSRPGEPASRFNCNSLNMSITRFCARRPTGWRATCFASPFARTNRKSSATGTIATGSALCCS